jgi:hypothetical protein
LKGIGCTAIMGYDRPEGEKPASLPQVGQRFFDFDHVVDERCGAPILCPCERGMVSE